MGHAAARDLHQAKLLVLADHGHEGTVADGQIDEMLQIALDGRIGGLATQILQVNRDLGTGNVDSDHRQG
jgi:hypothetical protein